MAFNPYYQNPYQPMGYNGQYGNYAPQNVAGAPQAFVCQITRVNGRNGAEAFRMAPNSSILLMDENDPIVWMKQTDGAGYATVTPYTVSPYQAIMMSMCPSLYPPRRQGRSLQRSSRTAWLFPVRQLPQMLRLARLLRWHSPLLCVRRVAHPALRCRWY